MLCCVSHACASVTNASNARSPLIYEPGDVRLTDSFALLSGLAPDSAWCRTSSVTTRQRAATDGDGRGPWLQRERPVRLPARLRRLHRGHIDVPSTRCGRTAEAPLRIAGLEWNVWCVAAG